MRAATSRLRRWARRLLWAGLALELAYLVAGNLFLLPRIGPPRLNRKPEKFHIQWSRGWTVIPGVVHLRGLTLKAKAGRGGWEAELDQVRGTVVLWDLSKRCFRLSSAGGSGLVFRTQLPPKATEVETGDHKGRPYTSGTKPLAEVGAGLVPALDTGDPKGRPYTQGSEPGNQTAKKPWRIMLDSVDLRQVRVVQVGPYLYRGEGLLSGSLRAQTRGGPLAVPRAQLDLQAGILEIDGEPAADLDLLKLELRLDEAPKAERKGRRFLRFLSGRLEVAAPEARLSSLGFLFRRIPSMDLDGDGSAHLVVGLDHGVLQPGTTLYAQGDSEVDYLDYTVRGSGEIAGAITETETGEAQGALDIFFERFELHQDGAEEPHVFGEGAQVQLTSAALDLVELDPEIRAFVEIPDSEVPNLAYYNRFLPPESGAAIEGGKGRISATMRLQAPAGTWDGDLVLRGEGLRVKIQDTTIETHLELQAKLSGGSIEARRTQISGTRLRIDRTRVLSKRGAAAAEGWWARLELPQGEMTLANPLALQTTFRATVKDTSPLLALVRKDKGSPPWLRKLLTVPDVAGTGEIRFRPKYIEARDLAFTGGKHIEVQGHLRLATRDLAALVFCRYRKLSASLEIEDGTRDWDLVGSRKWFHEKERTWLQ